VPKSGKKVAIMCWCFFLASRLIGFSFADPTRKALLHSRSRGRFISKYPIAFVCSVEL
jgi:hypothetical protein